MGAEKWEALSGGSRAAIRDVLERLSDGFTGSITLECHGGCVKRIRTTDEYSPKELVD